MATTNIVQFDSTAANLQTDANYDGSATQTAGFSSGLVPSNVLNKILFQCSFIATTWAQFCVAEGITINDSETIAQGVTAIQNALANFMTSGGGGPVSFIQVYSGNPNGYVAGVAGSASTQAPTLVWDIGETGTTSGGWLWVCTTSGTATTAVWERLVGNVGGLNFGLGVQNDGSGNLTLVLADNSLRLTSNGLQSNEPIANVGAGPHAIAAGNHFANFVGYGTFTLPKASTLWNGFCFALLANGGLATLTPNAADGFNGNGAGSGYQLQNGTSALFICDGANNWWVFNITTPVSVQGSPYNYAFQSGFIL